MKEYDPPHERRADELEHAAAQHFDLGVEATENADDYIFITVLLAAVLFFGGISLRFRWDRLRLAVLGLGGVFLVFGLFEIVRLPTH